MMHRVSGLKSEDSASVIVQYSLRPGRTAELLRALGDIEPSNSTFSGLIGTDVQLDPSGAAATVVWNFTSMDEARSWAQGDKLAAMATALSGALNSAPLSNVIVNPSSGTASTKVITTLVKPGNDAWFSDWQGRMAATEQAFPGYLGQRVQAPVPGVNPHWVTVLAFDTPASAAAWENSPERQALVEEAASRIEHFDIRPANSAFESWFAKTDGGGSPPPAWKLSAIVLLVLYPIVMLEFFTLNHLTQDDLKLTLPVGVFIGNAVSVAITGFLLIPFASKRLNWWLVPPVNDARRRTWQGGLLVLALYAVSVLIFWLLVRAFPWLQP